jgi:DNA polymerase-3 subunit alpha
VVAYQTAWLKYYYPVEFMTAMLNSCAGSAEKTAHYVHECGQMGIEVLPPDINQGQSKFSVSDGRIRFGLFAIRNVGYGAVDSIIGEREKNGQYTSFMDFLRRLGVGALNKRGLESLIKAGAFDSFDITRATLVTNYEKLLDGLAASRRHSVEGQLSMFEADQGWSGDENITNVKEFPHMTLLTFEKEMLGLYVSGHPLDEYKYIVEKYTDCDSRNFRESTESDGSFGGDGGGITGQDPLESVYGMYGVNGGNGGNGEDATSTKRMKSDGQAAIVGGIISKVKTKFTKTNNLMAFAEVEDFFGAFEMIVFPKVLAKFGSEFSPENVILAKGKVSMKEDEDAKFICEDIFLAGSGKEAGIDSAATEIEREIIGWLRNGRSGAGTGGNYGNNAGIGGDYASGNRGGNGGALYVRINGSVEKPLMNAAYSAMRFFSGNMPVCIYNVADKTVKKLDRSYWVMPTEALLDDLREKFGYDNVKIK